jgi:hypothetical protein
MTASTEVSVRRPQGQAAAIPAKLAYARALADSGLLPSAYRRNPANVLWAVEYGEMLGLPPMAAMTGVHVIEGKPTASAGLISGLVRQAGHKLRVWGTNKSATCEIIRSDDPGHTFSVTWTLKRNPDDHPSAEEAGLLGKSVWKQYPASMLKSRAITQCARDACEEVLYGLHYTPEELGAEVDEDGVVVGEIVDEPASQPADGNQWYVRPAPQDGPDGTTQDTRPWAEVALERAKAFESEAAGDALWREAAAANRNGRCTPDEATHIQNLVEVRITERRKEVSEALLALLPEADEWRDAVRGIADVEEARARLAEVDELVGTYAMDETRADHISGAIRARFPKAGVKNLQTAAA